MARLAPGNLQQRLGARRAKSGQNCLRHAWQQTLLFAKFAGGARGNILSWALPLRRLSSGTSTCATVWTSAWFCASCNAQVTAFVSLCSDGHIDGDGHGHTMMARVEG